MKDETRDVRLARRQAIFGRRTLLTAALGAAAWQLAGPGRARAQSSAGSQLPLHTTGLEHLGLLVSDVARAGQFYGRVFNPALYKEREGALRYYVTLGVGYVAIGAARDRPTQIDHYCALVEHYDRDRMAEALRTAGLEAGRFGMIPDPDGLDLQLLGTPGGLAKSTEPAGKITDDAPLVTPRGLAEIALRVSSLDRALPFYRAFFGHESARSTERATFDVAGTRLELRAVRSGERPRIDRFVVKVAPFDRDTVGTQLMKLGAKIDADEPGRLGFTDPDGIGAALVAA